MNSAWQSFLQQQAAIGNNEVIGFAKNPLSYETIQQQNCIMDLSDFAALKVSGADAKKFLQGQLTCDLNEVTPQQSRLSAYCTLKGRVLASCRVLHYNEDYYLWLPRAMLPILLQQLKKYALFSKITFSQLSEQWISFACAGEQMLPLLKHLAYPIPEASNAVAVLPHAQGILFNVPGTIARLVFLTELATAITIWQQLAQDFIQVDTDAWRLLDIHAGIATIYPSTSELFTPHMLNYPKWQAVSFNKGCYLGQEIIARAEYLGKTKRQLYRGSLSAQQQLKPGDKLLSDGQEAGIVVEAASNCLLAVGIEAIINSSNLILCNNQQIQLEAC